MGHVDVLSEAALSQSQLAFAAFSSFLQHEWTFLLHVVLQCSWLFQELELSLVSRFLPAMFGVEVSAVERCLFVLPLRLGSLGICSPVSLASHLFNSSVDGMEHLVRSIVGLKTFELDSYFDCVSSQKQFYHQQLGVIFNKEFGQLLGLFDSMQQRAKDGNISTWLSVLPLAWDAFGDLASLVWSPVVKEPIVCDGSAGGDTLITGLCVCGVWEPQTEALFDIRVVDTDAQSYHGCSPGDVLGSAEVEKKRKYLQACQTQYATFTHFVFW